MCSSRDLYRRGMATLVTSWEAYAGGSEEAAVINRRASRLRCSRASPPRAVYNNALLARDLGPAERVAALRTPKASRIRRSAQRSRARVGEEPNRPTSAADSCIASWRRRVKRGDWVLVEDAAICEGRVVVVIGVTAVIRVPRKDAVGDTYRAAEVRCCRPWVEAMLTRPAPELAPAGASRVRRVTRARARG